MFRISSFGFRISRRVLGSGSGGLGISLSRNDKPGVKSRALRETDTRSVLGRRILHHDDLQIYRQVHDRRSLDRCDLVTAHLGSASVPPAHQSQFGEHVHRWAAWHPAQFRIHSRHSPPPVADLNQHPTRMNSPARLLRLGLPALLSSLASVAQTTTPPPATADTPITLSAFEVSSSRDSGYRVQNAVATTGIAQALIDTPLPIHCRH